MNLSLQVFIPNLLKANSIQWQIQKVLLEIFHLPNSLKSPGWRLCAHTRLCAKSSIKENIKALQFSHWETSKHSQSHFLAHEMLMGQPRTAGFTDNGSDNNSFLIPIAGLQRWRGLPCFIVDDTLSACHVLQVSSGVHYISTPSASVFLTYPFHALFRVPAEKSCWENKSKIFQEYNPKYTV